MATGTIILPILAATPDATDPPGLVFVNNLPKLVFDAAGSEICYWTFRMPENYASAPVIKCQYAMASATTLGVIIGVEVDNVSDGDAQDLDAESYGTIDNSVNLTVPGTAGYMDEISLALANGDATLAAGDLVRLKFRRDHDHADDDATGDMEVWAVSLEYTTS